MQITLQELNMTYPNGKKALQGVRDRKSVV